MIKPPLVLTGLFDIARRQHEWSWQPFREGIEIAPIYTGENAGPAAALLRFQPGARVGLHEHLGFEHILVLSGSQADESGVVRAGSLMIHAPGTRHSIYSEEGCVVLAIYEKGVRFLRDEESFNEN